MRLLMAFSKGLIANNILQAHTEGINKCNEIIGQIDEELKLNMK
jgi:hypothetical protein